ncbi:uracil-xanthine permease family protein [Enterobacteriaceae bacterium H18W14]|uniref:uracil-xanthine permease family protein n=1 Tax=Dryocola boscaweniae TaxID=2925397 RepID=UPI0022F0BB15|nr:uracil-xanthine permease family protein [Dryocola boscaweniae]MCT4716847.1 uracil-xanthine permease family protein [Dryocola boscaweniae]
MPLPRPAVLNNEALSWQTKLLLAIQHVLVVAATPITAVFLIAKAFHFSEAVTTSVLSATFLMCGLGAIVQSLGVGSIGARLPFIMVPGGAPIAIFIAIALQTNIQTAVGAVILTSLFYFLALPVFRRFLHHFPPFIIGIMLLLVSINLIRLYGGLITGQPGSANFAPPESIALSLATILITLLFALAFTGILRQLSVMFGLLGGTILGILSGSADFSAVSHGPLFSVPQLFPFGWPVFNLTASLPLLIYAVISMAEAAGQTIATAEIVNSTQDVHKAIPRTVRGDAIMSLLGGIFGTSLIITSGENIGVVRTTNVKSRHVTAIAGLLLILIALFSPLVRLATCLPGPVVCGTAVIVFSIIGVIGIDMIAREPLHTPGKTYALATGLVMGMLPILVPGLYQNFPSVVQMVFGNGMAAGTLTAIMVNSLFLFSEKRAALRSRS